MSAPVKREFASLAERLSAPVDSTHEWLLVCVSVLMLSQVLRKSKYFITKFATKSFLLGMNVVMTPERKLSREAFTAAWEFAFMLEI